MDRDILLLSAVLCVLSLGVLVLGADLLMGSRRKAAMSVAPQDDLRAFLRIAPPMPPLPGQAAIDEMGDKPPLPEEFVFRRRVSREFATMEMSHKRFRPAVEKKTTDAMQPDILAIRSEIRAVLDAASPAAPQQPAPEAQLLWTEANRLAVLSLAGAAPEAGIALLKRHGIATLIAARGHPFHAVGGDIDILPLPDGPGATAPLAARLRAKLANGERVAFYTETGLNGAAALLAARFSSRQASQI